jgi:hypothetical protein
MIRAMLRRLPHDLDSLQKTSIQTGSAVAATLILLVRLLARQEAQQIVEGQKAVILNGTAGEAATSSRSSAENP